MPIGPRFALAPAGRSRLVPLHQSTAAIAHSCTGPLKEDALILAITSSSHETGLKPTFTATCRRRWRSICESPARSGERRHPHRQLVRRTRAGTDPNRGAIDRSDACQESGVGAQRLEDAGPLVLHAIAGPARSP